MMSSRKPSPRKPVPAPIMAYLLTAEPAGNPLRSDPTTTTAAVSVEKSQSSRKPTVESVKINRGMTCQHASQDRWRPVLESCRLGVKRSEASSAVRSVLISFLRFFKPTT
ncbi:hypothetical protein E2C01_042724 [Portunus trituberculatus]|uniref:Uncharacterized protein n=1 Tax=Portunus trituberculatus TaxID=210409 RepID=A0A5B7FTT3_PORTR|nr:hypothetical protein [Portunus trituberculatus]